MTKQTTPRISGILAVVVVYRMQPVDSQSLITLLASAAAIGEKSTPIRILVADNTPGGQQIKTLPPHVGYRAYTDNPGLALPYNEALLDAERDGLDWLLTLDQDSSLPITFLSEMVETANSYQARSRVAAIVPHIVDRGRTISPFRFLGGVIPAVLPIDASGLSGPHTSALNSCSLLRVSALRGIGGYDEDFPLHNSDTCLYHRLDAAGKQVVVAGKTVVAHELSILDRENRMSPKRYRQMLTDECTFWDLHMGPLGRIERLVRLLGRYSYGVLRCEEAAFQKVTLQEILRRVSTTRKVRLAGKT